LGWTGAGEGYALAAAYVWYVFCAYGEWAWWAELVSAVLPQRRHPGRYGTGYCFILDPAFQPQSGRDRTHQVRTAQGGLSPPGGPYPSPAGCRDRLCLLRIESRAGPPLRGNLFVTRQGIA